MEIILIIVAFLLFCFIVPHISNKAYDYDASKKRRRELRKSSNEVENRRENSVKYFEECRQKAQEESKLETQEPIVIKAPEVPRKEIIPQTEPEEKTYKPPRRKPAPLWLPEYITTEVKGTYYRDEFEKEAARLLEIGDELELWNEPDNRYDRHAVQVVTKEEWTGIGYVDANDSSFVFKNIENIDKVTVIKKSDHDIPYIKIKIQFKWDLESLPKNRDIIHYDRSKGDEYVNDNLFTIYTDNAEINWALDHWKENPQKALPIFEKYSEKERGIVFKHECCKCLRKLKRYEKEIEVIKQILERIRFPRNPNVSRMEHELMLSWRETFEKRFCMASKLLDGQLKKEKRKNSKKE